MRSLDQAIPSPVGFISNDCPCGTLIEINEGQEKVKKQ